MTVSTKNQIVGDTYDAAGNLITIPSTGSYAYDAENELCALGSNCNSPAYIYDGDGNRVEKTGSKIYWFSGSEILDETDQTGSVTNSGFSEYVFFGSARVARRDSSGNVYYYLADQIGSSRKILQEGQTTACYDADFEPFGGEHAYLNTCPQNYKFSGKERDTESNLDNFGARYYSSGAGRFMTPDWDLKPVAVPYAKFGDPQTLNLYAYVENSPLDRIDADGHLNAVSPQQCVPDCTNNEVDSNSDHSDYQNAEAKDAGVGQNPSQANTTIPIPVIPTLPSFGDALRALGNAAEQIATAVTDAITTTSVTVAGVAGYLVSPGTTATQDKDTIHTSIPGSTSAQGKVDTSPLSAKEHTKGARPSTRDKHTKPRPGRATTKDRQNPKFKPRTPPRPQDIEDDSKN